MDNQFEGMRFNPLSKDLLKEYPELKSIESWNNLKNYTHYDLILKYIVAVYSKDSPLIKIPDYDDRVTAALKALGITKAFNIYDHLVNITGEEGKFDTLLLIHDYLVFQQDKLFSLIIIHERNFYLLQKEMMEESTAKDDNKLMIVLEKKSKMMAEMDAISKRLDSYYSEFFMNTHEVREKIERLDFCSPESVVKYLKRIKGE